MGPVRLAETRVDRSFLVPFLTQVIFDIYVITQMLIAAHNLALFVQ